MYIVFLLLSAIKAQNEAKTLIDDTPLLLALTRPEQGVVLDNKMQHERFAFCLLKESRKFNSRITSAGKKLIEIAQKDQENSDNDAQGIKIENIEFSASHRIDKIYVPKNFNFSMFKDILNMRESLRIKLDKMYYKDKGKLLFEMLEAYYDLDYSIIVKERTYDSITRKETNIPVEKIRSLQ
ncbi:hypothetical protein ENBRE01_2451 [Enteropsectra breve]|nr:hypothetical protein ENBRE01_2451 [Enteropsectra breve]